MKKYLIALCAVAAALVTLISCNEGVPYKVAKNYFFRNDAAIPADPLVKTREQFESLFGMATVMGKDGMPTEIDFEKEFVIALVLPETSCPTTITPLSLTDNGETLLFQYKVERQEESTFTMVPCMVLVVDRQHLKCVTLKEVR